MNALARNYIRIPLSTSVNLHRKEDSKPSGIWFQLLMVIFMKIYLPIFGFIS